MREREKERFETASFPREFVSLLLILLSLLPCFDNSRANMCSHWLAVAMVEKEAVATVAATVVFCMHNNITCAWTGAIKPPCGGWEAGV